MGEALRLVWRNETPDQSGGHTTSIRKTAIYTSKGYRLYDPRLEQEKDDWRSRLLADGWEPDFAHDTFRRQVP